jgi:plastocyanin domain-containing protein
MEEYFSKPKNLLITFTSIVTSTILFFAIVYLVFFSGNATVNSNAQAKIENGIQTVEIAAKNGYKFTTANTIKADKPAKLKIDTNGTIDCTSSLSIPQLEINKILPPTGTTTIDIPAQKAGTIIKGYCSMRMYSFEIPVI